MQPRPLDYPNLTPYVINWLQIQAVTLWHLCYRAVIVEFEKPAKQSEEASLLSSKQQVKRLEKELERKDKDIELLREQLQKAHRENDLLVEQLKGWVMQREGVGMWLMGEKGKKKQNKNKLK